MINGRPSQLQCGPAVFIQPTHRYASAMPVELPAALLADLLDGAARTLSATFRDGGHIVRDEPWGDGFA